MQRYKSVYKPRSLRRLEKRSKRNILISIITVTGIIYFMLSWGFPTLVGSLSFLNRFKPITKTNPASNEVLITPPVLNIPYEATNSASIKISGYSTPKFRVEVYFNDDLKNTVDVQEDGSFQTKDIPLNLGANNIYGKTVNKEGNKSLPSKTIKLIYSNEKPKLEITEPADGQQILGGDEQSSLSGKKIRVSGKTEATNSITINGNTVIVNGDGNFSKIIDINEGDNVIFVVATNSVGNSTQVERKVTYFAQ